MLAAKSVMLVVTLATIGLTVYLYYVVPKGFFPQEDTGFLSGICGGRDRHLVRRNGRAAGQA